MTRVLRNFRTHANRRQIECNEACFNCRGAKEETPEGGNDSRLFNFKLIDMKLDKTLLDNLLVQAAESPRLRMNLDLRTSEADGSQRMLNALLPGSVLPIHRHTKTTETLVLLRGRMEEIFFEEGTVSEWDGDSRCKDLCRRRVLRETSRVLLEAGGDVQGFSIPVGQWHTVNVLEPTVILECKDGKYEPLGKEDMIEGDY